MRILATDVTVSTEGSSVKSKSSMKGRSYKSRHSVSGIATPPEENGNRQK